MNTTEQTDPTIRTESETEYVTFCVDDLLLGVEIDRVDEINRRVDVTPVPHAPPFVCGVLNLRGEVVTVVDLRMILGRSPADSQRATRTLIVRSKGEQIGLRVDEIADVVRARRSEIDPVPSNLGGTEGRYFEGVHKLESELLIILDIDAALT
ncbi:MAG: chemotaxis protein CheW [Planctomycetes bacterium]|nr:chemotaxis protein CheW [Planctomycetota bacterium]